MKEFIDKKRDFICDRTSSCPILTLQFRLEEEEEKERTEEKEI